MKCGEKGGGGRRTQAASSEKRAALRGSVCYAAPRLLMPSRKPPCMRQKACGEAWRCCSELAQSKGRPFENHSTMQCGSHLLFDTQAARTSEPGTSR